MDENRQGRDQSDAQLLLDHICRHPDFLKLDGEIDPERIWVDRDAEGMLTVYSRGGIGRFIPHVMFPEVCCESRERLGWLLGRYERGA